MKKLLAALLALLTMAAFLTSCGKTKVPDVTPTTPVNGVEETEPDDESLTSETDPTEEPSTAEGETTTLPDGTTLPGETTLPDGSTAAATTQAAVATPATVAEIVSFYNNAANNTKAQQNFTADLHNVLECHITEGILSIVDSALNDLRENTTIKEVYKNGKPTKDPKNTVKATLPVKGQAYMSRLQPQWVKSATCTKNADGTFTIKIAMKEETFKAKSEDPKQHHSCMDTLDVDWNGLPFDVHDDTMGRIHDATITAKVAKDGQLLKELHIYEPVEVKGQVKVLVWAKITVEGFWKQDIIFS